MNLFLRLSLAEPDNNFNTKKTFLCFLIKFIKCPKMWEKHWKLVNFVEVLVTTQMDFQAGEIGKICKINNQQAYQ